MKQKAPEKDKKIGSSKKAAAGGDAESGDKDFLVVGVGASAGGVKALQKFFQGVSPDSNSAYVVILHLSPDYDSRLAEILQNSATIPVKQVKNRLVEVKPNCVYVIPPNKSLKMIDGHLAVSPIKSYEDRRAPIDIFFRTLAESVESRAVAVILSGTGPDGSMGAKRIKEKGGVIFVQDPKEAEFSDMPRSSIATELVDDVLPVARIPSKIAAYREKYRLAHSPSKAARDDRDPEPADRALVEILTQLRVKTGHDFTNYKRGTVLRRIDRRINVRELSGLPAYARYLKEHPAEANLLLKDLLISVTNFFRDRAAFEKLENEIVPRILEGKTAEDSVRVWVAGCATGEEAYSLAMIFAEQTFDRIDMPRVQIFATDIDDEAITTAREALYTNSDVADVSPERLRRFFKQESEEFRVRREIREMVLFAAHNLLKNPPFSRLDLATCRNLLIYLNPTAQKRVIETLHFALRPNAFLFLGMSESIEGTHDLFVPVRRELHLYQSRPVATRFTYPVESSSNLRFEKARQNNSAEKDRIVERLSNAALHLQLLEYYAPPSVVVNEEYEIIHTSEKAGRFMHITGDPSLNLVKIVRSELRLELRTALYQAVQHKTDVRVNDLKVYFEGAAETVNILVRPIQRQFDGASGLILVVFEPSRSNEQPAVAESIAAPESLAQIEPIARQLEDELIWTKMQLRTTIEQYELQTEELKAANEEQQATMEEAHSSNEELETSKEELQSVNEELTTVNQELKIKIEELSLANDDFQNLINSTDIGTMFLDRGFKIKMFTPNMRNIFNLLPTDLERSLTDITTTLDYPDMIADLESVSKNLQPVEREVLTRDGHDFLMRILPYRTTGDRIRGVVLTFVDITNRKANEGRLRESEENLRLLVESATDYAIFTVTPENLIKSWNKGAERIFGYREKEILGKSGAILFTPEDRAKGAHLQELQTALATGRAEDERWHLRRDGTQFFASGIMQPLSNRSGGFVKIARDMTAKIQAEQVQRDKETLQKLVGAQEEERRRIARDLHDELGQQLTALRLKLEALRKNCDDEELCAQIEEAQALAGQIDKGVDFLSWELRPAALDDLGLMAAIEKYAREWSQYTGIETEVLASSLKKARFLPEVETNLYRIVQEAFNNIHKHAAADRVELQIEKRDDSIVLVIEDDGRGFDPEKQKNHSTGIGLIGIQERALLMGGAFEIESVLGGGTALYVRVPLAAMKKKGRK